MTIRHPIRLIGLVALFLTIAGCASVNTDERISVAPALTGTLEIEQVVTGRTDGGLVQVHVRARNLIDQPLLMNYQFEWLDDQGRAITSVLSSKNRLTADRRRGFSIRGVAPSPDVAQFRLYLDEREL